MDRGDGQALVRCLALAALLHGLPLLFGFGRPAPVAIVADADDMPLLWFEASSEQPAERPGGAAREKKVEHASSGPAEPPTRAVRKPNLAAPRQVRGPARRAPVQAPAEVAGATVARLASGAEHADTPVVSGDGAAQAAEGKPLSAGLEETAGAGHAGGAGRVPPGTGESPGPGAPTVGSGQKSSGPRLLTTMDPCRGFFPVGARTERGRVRVAVAVDAAGHARARQVLLEQPADQGFAAAASACVARLAFVPARDQRGTAVAGLAKLQLEFNR